MEARAVKRFIPSSPRKMRLIADLVRGKNAQDMIRMLSFHPKHASKDVAFTIKSALANLVNKNEDAGVRPEEVIIKTIMVDQGPSLKRIRPAPQGRAYRIKKRSCHLTVVVETINKYSEE
ncbi:MAG: 50S ribosomal protein L22 [Ignavibacteriaceae bacterium]|nr:50S ribosomal protein L22 [Ignavibacteriaceae bacterium]